MNRNHGDAAGQQKVRSVRVESSANSGSGGHVWCNSSETRTGAAATCLGPRGTGQLSQRVPVDFTNSVRWSGRGYAPRYDTLRHGRHVCDVLRCSEYTGMDSKILGASACLSLPNLFVNQVRYLNKQGPSPSQYCKSRVLRMHFTVILLSCLNIVKHSLHVCVTAYC